MHRLSVQIYVTVVGALVLLAVLAGVLWVVHPATPWERDLSEGLAATAAELLPPGDRPVGELQATVERLASRLDAGVTVFDADGHPLASSGPEQRLGPPGPLGRGWLRPRLRGVTVTLPLPDGRVLVAGRSRVPGQRAFAFFVTLALLFVAVAIGSWPLVRRLTRRVERLRRSVEDLGRGDLQARVAVEGNDEVADLARSFNRAAERIETLVEAQRRTLAFASHELRSPLARLRVSLEMVTADPALRERAQRDITELDGLIDELLEASRLQGRGAVRREPVDLLGLVAEEGARAGADVAGEALEVAGDPRLLRRLVRNLLENARRHGGEEVAARVERVDGRVRLRVLDRGPGIPEAEREDVFAPFYRPAGQSESGGGYGLGLALVRQIARAHGGEARCLGREGGGTAIEVDLPALASSLG